jgi:predicted alpha/beta-hydrolase family hydrolase
MSAIEHFVDAKQDQPAVNGFLHRPECDPTAAMVLTHGAGSNCGAPLLIAVAEAFAAAGITVLRCDLPFRQARPHGPPVGNGAKDRAGLRRAIEVLREIALGPVFLGGHSYGGRQASMLAAEDPSAVAALLLLSYPLHPPHKPDQLRTAHFPNLRTPALFVHGCRDPFGSCDEMQSAIRLIPGPTAFVPVEGAGHDLGRGKHYDLARRALADLLRLVNQNPLAKYPTSGL